MPKLIGVRIRNFKSFPGFELKLGRFTTILGRNDSGKSGCIQAIMSALINPSNPPGKRSRIRRGAKSMEISLDLDDGMVINYHKGISASYVISTSGGSVSYDKMGRDAPAPVLNLVKPWVVEGIKPVIVQIKQQGDPAFILSETGNAKSNLFDNIEGRIFRQAVTSCEASVRRMKRTQSQLLDQQESWSQKVDSLSDLLPLASEYTVLRRQAGEFSKILLDLYISQRNQLLVEQQQASGVLARIAELKITELKNELVSVESELEHVDYLLLVLQESVITKKLTAGYGLMKTLNKEIFKSGQCPLCGSVISEDKCCL